MEEGESLSNNSKRTFVLLKGTILAYNICELKVSGGGGLELIVDKDVMGQFTDSVDGQSGTYKLSDLLNKWHISLSLTLPL